jgi:hypothetical protein
MAQKAAGSLERKTNRRQFLKGFLIILSVFNDRNIIFSFFTQYNVHTYKLHCSTVFLSRFGRLIDRPHRMVGPAKQFDGLISSSVCEIIERKIALSHEFSV